MWPKYSFHNPMHYARKSHIYGMLWHSFYFLLLLWTLELYLILSYRYEDLLISWSYRSYLNDLILAILSLDLRSYLDLLILSSDDDPRYVSLHYYLHAFDMPLTHVFHWWSTCILHMLLHNMLLPYIWHALNIYFTCVCLEDNTWTLVYKTVARILVFVSLSLTLLIAILLDWLIHSQTCGYWTSSSQYSWAQLAPWTYAWALSDTDWLSWSMLGHVLSEEQSKDGSDRVSDDGRLTIVQCHHYHRPPSSDLYWSSVGILPLLQYHQPNLHSYHCHYQPTPCAIYRSTTTAPPCSTHVPCSRPNTLRTHQSRGHESWSPQGPARIYVGTIRNMSFLVICSF